MAIGFRYHDKGRDLIAIHPKHLKERAERYNVLNAVAALKAAGVLVPGIDRKTTQQIMVKGFPGVSEARPRWVVVDTGKMLSGSSMNSET